MDSPSEDSSGCITSAHTVLLSSSPFGQLGGRRVEERGSEDGDGRFLLLWSDARELFLSGHDSSCAARWKWVPSTGSDSAGGNG